MRRGSGTGNIPPLMKAEEAHNGVSLSLGKERMPSPKRTLTEIWSLVNFVGFTVKRTPLA